MPSGIKKVFLTKLTEVATATQGDKEGVGTIRFEGNKVYKWVKFNNGAGNVASVAGNMSYYYGVGGDAADGDGYEDSIVTMDRTDGFMCAGVFQAIIADLGFGWIQIKGPATLTTAFTAGADGNAMHFAGAGADGTIDVSGLVTDDFAGVATDHSAEMMALDCPF